MNTRRSVLVVDDSSTIRQLIAGMLRDLDFSVSEAHNGLDALQHCRQSVPDIVMLDWNMPEMDGLSCLRALRALALSKRPTVVMCTTEKQMAKIQEALSAGADEYIMKPFSRDVLLDKLAQLGEEC